MGHRSRHGHRPIGDRLLWGAYSRYIDPGEHQPGKRNTQKIERKHLTLRARIKWLARKTICFFKSMQMYDIVLGLFVNR